RHQERHYQNVHLVRENVVLELVREHHDGVEGKGTTDQSGHREQAYAKKGKSPPCTRRRCGAIRAKAHKVTGCNGARPELNLYAGCGKGCEGPNLQGFSLLGPWWVDRLTALNFCPFFRQPAWARHPSGSPPRCSKSCVACSPMTCPSTWARPTPSSMCAGRESF